MEHLQTMNQDSRNSQVEAEQDNRWILGIVIGIGIAVALSSALDSVLLGIPVGIGAGFLFTASLCQQGIREDESNGC